MKQKDCYIWLFEKFSKNALLGLFAILSMGLNVDAQTADNSSDSTKRPINFVFSVGGGVNHFLGDVRDASDRVTADIFGNRAVADLNLGVGLSRSFVLNFNAIYGKISGNENTFRQHRNFETQLVLLGVNAEYNFAGLYKKELPVVNPFIIGGVYYGNYFNISSDLYYDGNNPYHYWSDGTIRDLAETEDNRDIARNVGRDYDYETSLVKGSVHSFMTGVGVGLDLHLSRTFSFRIMSRYFFAFNDKIDGYYQGNAKGLSDGYFLNQLSLVVNTAAFGKKGTGYQPDYKYLFDASKLSEVESEDQDGDGVKDLSDRCAFTPNGVAVDEEGCPLDSDVDGIPDYRDKEKSSAAGAIVDRNGVTVNYQIEAERFFDSLGVYRINWNIGYLTGEPFDNEKYTVNIKTVKKGSEKLLSPAVGAITELRRKVINDSLVLFTLGVYDHFDEADQRSKRLNVLGEAQAYGVAESESERVASDLYLLNQTADPSLVGRSYGIKKNLSDIKESKAYQFPMLGYSVGRFEKHIDNDVPEYLLVKDFLNSISTFTWDSIVKRSYKEVELNLERMPIPEKPEYDILEPKVKSASNELSSGSDTLKIRHDQEVESSNVSEDHIVPLPKKETLVSMAPVKPAFANGDLDRNGFITASEIERTLEEIMEGRSKVTVAQFNEMVQYYTYFTDNADPIDFGGTEVVIVDGVLTILKKEGEGFGDESRRILAKKYEEVDFNKDGDLTADEVQKMINLFMEGKSSYSAERIYELIDLFFE